MRLIWLAFLAAPVVYGVVAGVAIAAQPDRPWPMPLTAIFALLALVSAVAGFFWPGFVQRHGISSRPRTGPDPDPYRTAMITRWACFEAVAIYGVVLSFVSAQLLPTVVGAVVALALIAASPPRPADAG